MTAVDCGLIGADAAAGHYEIWVGQDLPREVPNILVLLATAGSRAPASLAIHPGAVSGATWAGDALAPVGPSLHPGTISLGTSGTTGPPKRSVLSVPRVLEGKRGGAPSDRWVLTYGPSRWAGVSVLTHCLRFRATIIVPDSLELRDILRAGDAEGATHVSLTPSLFRRALIEAPLELRKMRIRQVTFGGEPASQVVIDLAADVWPGARVTHTYASSEAGDICSASDGLAGYARAKFARFELRETGELVIDGRPSGDLWTLRGDRYHFVGRLEEVINVGGAKVSPTTVEDAAMRVDGVQQARAFAVPSALMGSLVALDYVGDCDEDALLAALRSALPKAALPARVQHVDVIELSDAGKVRRLA